MEIRARSLRIILLVLAIAIQQFVPFNAPIDPDTLSFGCVAAALLLPPILHSRAVPGGLGFWDWSQIAVQLLGPLAIFGAARIEDSREIAIFFTVFLYALMIFAVLAGDIIGIVRKCRRQPS